MTTNSPLNIDSSFSAYELSFLNINSEENIFSSKNISKILIDKIQDNMYPLYLLNDIESNIEKIAAKQQIIIGSGESRYTYTDQDKISFLSIIGDIIGLPFFNFLVPVGFILDLDRLDINNFDESDVVSSISAWEYARCLKARILKFFGSANLSIIYDSVQLVSMEDSANVIMTFPSPVEILFTITSSNIPRLELFMEYQDKFGYNLWVKPSYGIVSFVYQEPA